MKQLRLFVPVMLAALAIVLATTVSLAQHTPPHASSTPTPSPAATSATSLARGAVMPSRDVHMRTTDGRDLTLGGLPHAHGTLVVFTCNHCPFARAWDARITAIGNEAVNRGFGVVAINSNDPTQHAEDGLEGSAQHAHASGYHFAYAIDSTSDVARAFGATHTPEAFLFDAQSRLVYHGAIDDNADDAAAATHHYLHDAIDAVAAGTPIAQAETRSIGCTIKFHERAAASGH